MRGLVMTAHLRRGLLSVASCPGAGVPISRPAPVRHLSSSSKSTSEDILVYHSPLTAQVFAVKGFSLFSSFVGLAAQPYLYVHLDEMGPMKYVALGGFGAFICVTPLLLHLITRSFVTKLYYNYDTRQFTAYTKGIFLNNRRLEFQAGDASVPTAGLPFATIKAKGKPLFFVTEYFTDLSVYQHMLGHDTPLEWRLDEKGESKKRKQ